jgi:hypothetical protein
LDVALFEECGRIAIDHLPPLGLIERGVQDAVHVMHSARRQAALPVPPAVFDRLRISLAYLDRLQLRKDLRPEQWREVLIEQIAIAFMGFRRNVRLDVRAAVEAGEQEITELHAKLHAAHDR